ncbi:MAG TPA: hypothetical protein VFU88_14870 [Ktedonobacterales bacterium]|nr:hypothetical protein [Ktedonobacterales bacterium]
MDQQHTSAAGGSQPIDQMSGEGQSGMQNQGRLDPDVQGVLNPNPGNLQTNSPDLAVDPVCGMTVEKANATNTLPAPVNMQGEGTIYFCSPECKATFEKEPSRFGYSY